MRSLYGSSAKLLELVITLTHGIFRATQSARIRPLLQQSSEPIWRGALITRVRVRVVIQSFHLHRNGGYNRSPDLGKHTIELIRVWFDDCFVYLERRWVMPTRT
jgi:hypothetical protein